MIDTTNFDKYFGERRRVIEQVIQHVADHPATTYKEIASMLGCTPQLVSYYARKYGMRRPRGRKPQHNAIGGK